MRRLCPLVLLLPLLFAYCATSADVPPVEKTDEAPPPPEEPREKLALTLDTGGHTAEVVALAFTPDEHELMSASRDGTVRFWDLNTGESVQVLRPPTDFLHAAALSPDGQLVAVAGKADKEMVIQLLVRHGDQVRTLKEHDDTSVSLAFSRDGKWLASAGPAGDGSSKPTTKDNHLRLWNVASGERAFVQNTLGNPAHAVVFAPDGDMLATGAPGGECWTWSVPAGKRLARIEGPKKAVLGIDWSPDGGQIATAGPDGVHLWHVKERKSTPLHNVAANRVIFSGDGRKLLILPNAEGAERTPHVRDLSGNKVQVFTEHTSKVTAGALSHDGSLAATAGGTAHEIYVWHTATPHRGARRLVGHGRVHYGAAWAPDGKAVAWGDQDVGRARSFHAQVPLHATFSLDSLLLKSQKQLEDYQRAELSRGGLSLNLQGNHRWIEVKNDTKVIATRPSPYQALCATLLPGDRGIIAGGGFGLVLFDPTHAADVYRLRGHQSGVLAVACSRDGHYLLSSGEDQTLRIWDLERLKIPESPPKEPLTLTPLLSLFVAQRDWIAWAPEGYYASSPNGEHLMGWQVDNGPDRLLSFFPAEQFRKSLYRPDIIKALLTKGSIEKTVWEIDKERKPIQAAEVLPPTVAITEPGLTAILDKPELTVKATAEGAGFPVTALQLLIDGRPYAEAQLQLAKDAKTGKAEGTWKLKAPPGRHRYSVLAQTEKSQGRSSEIYVTNVAPPPAPRLFFLAIGINSYQNVPPLNCAVNDAEKLAAALAAQRGTAQPLFGDIQTQVLTDTKATPKAILEGLDWLQKNAEPDDEVVIFYAGHGERDDKGDFQLLTAAFNPQKPAGTTVSGKELKTKLAAVRSRRILLLLDACHSGAIGTDALAGELKQPDCGVVVLCAARGDESSLESQKEQHGFFTKWLLDGLSGGAANDAGEITLARLYVHVDEKVPMDTSDRQHPVMVGLAAIRSFALARKPK